MFVSLKTGQAQCRSLLVCKFDVSALFKALAHGVVMTHTSAGFIDSELEKLGAAFWKRTLVFLLRKLLRSCIYTTICMCPSTQELKPVLLLLLKPVTTHRGNFSLCSPSPWCCSQNILLSSSESLTWAHICVCMCTRMPCFVGDFTVGKRCFMVTLRYTHTLVSC